MQLKDGQIVQGKFYQAVNGAYGFLEIPGYEEHIFVFGGNKADALDQDIVEAKIKIFKGKFEAEIIKVVRRAERLLMGEFQKTKSGYGFVKPFNPAIKTDIFIPERFTNDAKNKDIVVVRVLRWEGKNPEGKIVEVLGDKTNPETIINGYILESGFKLNFPQKVLDEIKGLKNDAIGYFDKHLKNDNTTEKIIGLAYKVQNELGYGLEEKVYQNALKVLLEKEGFKVKKEVKVPLEIDGTKVGHGRIDLLVNDKIIIEIKKSFDKTSTVKQIKKYLSEEKPIALAIYFSNEGVKINRFEYDYYHKESSKNHKNSSFRKDLRNLFTFTIDGEDARDLDDAISIEKLSNGEYKLYVHIADVAHYVKPGSATQNEAYLRATSVYLPHKVLPMLPERLSNDLCSLNPNTDKLTLTCEMDLDSEGNLKGAKVYESVINSNYRLTYKEVQQMYDKQLKEGDILMFGGKITAELLNKINIAYELKNKVSKNKEEQGVLGFDFPETKIIVDENLQVVDFKPYPIYESNKLIEEFMILANQSVSKKFSKIPFLYRIHEKPKSEDIERLKKILDIFGIHFNFVNYDTKEYADLIKEVQKHKERYILEKLILRTLQKAIYSDKNLGHFGLGLDFYSHFTSPIRRYPDYQIHRIIKQKLHGKLSGKTIQLYKSKLEQIAKHCSEQEIKAQKLEWKVRDFFMVQYYKDKIGQEFEGIISGMIPAGIFVALENTAEGFVQLIKKDEDLSEREPDLEILQFKNNKTGEILSIGQTVKVKLISVDEDLLRLNFQLIHDENSNKENPYSNI